MKRTTPIALAGMALLATASGQSPKGDEAPPTPEATPTASASENASETAAPEGETAQAPATAEKTLIPTAFQGKWGETEEYSACAAGAAGGLTITGNELRYEGLGTVTVSDVRRIDADTIAIEGRYAETGQAPSKDVEEKLKLANGGAHLSEIFAGTVPFDYIRC